MASLGLITFCEPTLSKHLHQLVLIVPVLVGLTDELVDAFGVLGGLGTGLGVSAFVGRHEVVA